MNKCLIVTIFASALGFSGSLFSKEMEPEPNIGSHEQAQETRSEESEKPVIDSPEENGVSERLSQKKLTAVSGKTVWEQGGFPERLQVADLDIPLLFEGPISEELKQVILADIRLIYGKGTTFQRYDWSGRPDNPVFEISGDQYLSVETINLRSSQVPNLVHGKLNRLIEIDEIEYIVVPHELIKSYEQAWAARISDSEKYEELEFFLDWVNSASLEALKDDNPFWLLGYDGILDSHPKEVAKMKEELLLTNFEHLRVGHPSLLEFTHVDLAVLESYGSVGELPLGVTLADGKNIGEDGMNYGQMPLLYDGNKWFILFGPGGE